MVRVHPRLMVGRVQDGVVAPVYPAGWETVERASSWSEPEIEPVQDSNGKEYCPGQQEAPHPSSEAGEYMGQPCKETQGHKKVCHLISPV
jgi:hypothetical protein